MIHVFRRAVLAALTTVVTASILTAPIAAAQSSGVASSGRGCGSVAAGLTCVEDVVELAGAPRDVVWYLPSGPASALMLVEHGFSRSCANLHGTAQAIAAQGLMVVCLDEDMTAGNPTLAAAFADALAERSPVPPNSAPLPHRYVVGGHSAGGHFAALVGARLVERGYPDLAGAVLFDPVAAKGFTAALQTVSASGARPVLSIAARPSLVNLFGNSFGALASLGADFVGVQLLWSQADAGRPVGGSCHIDAEGEDTDLIGIAGAGCAPDPVQTARLRDFAGTWARDLATGTRTPSRYCADATEPGSCGEDVAAMLAGVRPAAAVIPAR